MAQATVTLTTITLLAAVTQDQRHWTVSNTDGLLTITGQRLYVGQELVTVEQITSVSGVVVVRRGVDGTAATAHPAGATLYSGRGDQFYAVDPVGTPPNPILVYPYINVITGTLWGVTGDETGPGVGARIWTPITNVYGIGALGVRTTTTTTPS